MNALKIWLLVLVTFFSSVTKADEICLKFLGINVRLHQQSELILLKNIHFLEYSKVYRSAEVIKDRHCISALFSLNLVNHWFTETKWSNSNTTSSKNLRNFLYGICTYIKNGFHPKVTNDTNDIISSSFTSTDQIVKTTEFNINNNQSSKKEQFVMVAFESFFFGVLLASILLNISIFVIFRNKSIIQYVASLLMLTLYWISKLGIISMLFDEAIILNRILDWFYFPSLLLIYYIASQTVQPKQHDKATRILFLSLVAIIPISIILSFYNHSLQIQLMVLGRTGLLILFFLFFACNYRNATRIGKRILWFCKLLIFSFLAYFMFNRYGLTASRIVTFQTIFIINQIVWFSFVYLIMIEYYRNAPKVNDSGTDTDTSCNQTNVIEEQLPYSAETLLDMAMFNSNIDFINSNFYRKIKSRYPEITIEESKLLFYISIGFKTKDISVLTQKSINSIDVAKCRLRKKIGLQKNVGITEIMNLPLLF